MNDWACGSKESGDARPFVHLFRTSSNHYVYDVNTCRILHVAPVLWDLLPDFAPRAKQKAIAKHSHAYAPSELGSAWQSIAHQQEKGFFLSCHPRAIELLVAHEQVASQLEAERQQLLLEITEECNLRCSYCVYNGHHQYRRTHSRRTMPWPIARKAIDDFLIHSQLDQPLIGFHGGEPLLNMPLMRRCIEYVESRNSAVKFSITTNGTLLEGETSDFLAHKDFIIGVSLNGPAELHDRDRRTIAGDGTWHTIVENLRRFVQKWPRYWETGGLSIVTTAVPPVDLREFDHFFSSWHLLGPAIGLAIFRAEMGEGCELRWNSRVGERAGGGVQGVTELYREFLVSLEAGLLNQKPRPQRVKTQAALFELDVRAFYERPIGTAQQPRLPEAFCPLSTCIPGVRRVFVTCDGQYYPCERTQQSEATVIGNVYEGISIKKVMRLLEAYVAANSHECASCWCVSNCRVGCLAMILDRGAISAEYKREACERYRRTMDKMARDLCTVLERNPDTLDFISM